MVEMLSSLRHNAYTPPRQGNPSAKDQRALFLLSLGMWKSIGILRNARMCLTSAVPEYLGYWRHAAVTSRQEDSSRKRGQENHGPRRPCQRRHCHWHDQGRAGEQQGMPGRVGSPIESPPAKDFSKLTWGATGSSSTAFLGPCLRRKASMPC